MTTQVSRMGDRIDWTDQDGDTGWASTDPEELEGSAFAVLAAHERKHDQRSAGIYLSREQATELRDWLTARLEERS